MEVVKGTVQQISVKERKSGEYRDWASFGIKVNDTWYNGALNADKKTNELVLKDKDYNPVLDGMEVEFLLVEKKGYKNIDSKTFKILASGSAVTQQVKEQPTGQVTEQAPGQVIPKKISQSDIGIWLACQTDAVALAKGTTFQVGDKNPEEFATDKVFRMTKILFDKAIERGEVK